MSGKQKNLADRVSSYFFVRDLPLKTQYLVNEVKDFDLILTQTEVEALLLERTLIREHQPRYNILLRDDKEYPFVRIDMNAKWPRVEKVRRKKDDGALYLGPYGNPGALKLLLDAAGRIFPLIRCSPQELEGRKRPCNYFQMKLCLAPCVLPVDPEEYKDMLRDVASFSRAKTRRCSVRSKKKWCERPPNINSRRRRFIVISLRQ